MKRKVNDTNTGTKKPVDQQTYASTGQEQAGQTGYSESEQPMYIVSGYPYSVQQETSGGKGKVALIAGIAALIVVLAVVLIVLMSGNQGALGGQGNGMPPGPGPGPQPAPASTMENGLDYSSYTQYEKEDTVLTVDGEAITLPRNMLYFDDVHFVSIQDFAAIFGYETVVDIGNRQTIISKDTVSVTFTNEFKTVVVKENGEVTRKAVMLREPMIFSNNQVYVPLRSMDEVFGFQSVEWNQDTDTIEIVTDGNTVAVTTTVESSEATVLMPGFPGSGAGQPAPVEQGAPAPGQEAPAGQDTTSGQEASDGQGAPAGQPEDAPGAPPQTP